MKAWGIRCVEDGYQGQGISRAKGEWHHYEFDTREEAEASWREWCDGDWVMWEVAERTPEERINYLLDQVATYREANRELARCIRQLRKAAATEGTSDE